MNERNYLEFINRFGMHACNTKDAAENCFAHRHQQKKFDHRSTDKYKIGLQKKSQITVYIYIFFLNFVCKHLVVQFSKCFFVEEGLVKR